MKKIVVALCMIIGLMISLCACGGGMSHDDYEKYSQMEEDLEIYKSMDEYHILTEDAQADIYGAIAEQYGEDVADNIMDIIFENSHELSGYF